jgi:hypothetical protein
MSLRVRLFTLGALLSFAIAGCSSGPEPVGDRDTGVPNMDGGMYPDGAFVPPADTGVRIDAPGLDVGCVPGIEICGDHVDQNCDGHDTSCGDTDGDGHQACRAGQDLTMCDCDDSRADVYPPLSGVAGGAELCDGRDNDCNGRVDEASECCDGCASLGADRERGDVCTETGECDCSTEAGVGVCPVGETCCVSGCVNTATDINNCGLCGAACTAQSDSCSASMCSCGGGPPCDKARMCSAGSC